MGWYEIIENLCLTQKEKHTSLESIYNVFVNFMEGKIPYLPWYEKKLDLETELIRENLIKLNKHGFLTINSQVSFFKGSS